MILRWPSMRALVGWPLFGGGAALALGFVVGYVAVASYISAYASGLTRGYAEGVVDGHYNACSELAVQSRWALNVEHQLVTSGDHSPAEGSVVNADSMAAVRYTCNPAVSPTPNPYDPAASPPPLPPQSPTLPIAPPRHPVKRI